MSFGYATRVDKGSPALVQAARELGFTVVLLRGAIDAIFWSPRTGVVLVDFKASAKSRKTKTQQALLSAGVPIEFVWNVEQILAMVQR